MGIKARTDGLIVKELGQELAIYDEREHRAHELNATAASVWRHCDGESSIRDIAAAMAAESGLPADEEIVKLGIEQLSRGGLLEEIQSGFDAPTSRRQVIRRLGLVGSAALLLPAVTTIVAPTRAMAASAPMPTPAPTPLATPMPTLPTPPPTSPPA